MNLSDESWPTDVPSNHYVLLIVVETKSSKSNNTAGAGTNIVDAAATTAATGDARQAPVDLQPAEREVVVIVRVLARLPDAQQSKRRGADVRRGQRRHGPRRDLPLRLQRRVALVLGQERKGKEKVSI